MKDILESATLYSYMGTHTPYWRLSEDSNTLHLSVTEATDRTESVELAPEQAERIRDMTVITSSRMMTLPFDDNDIPVHLVGRKISKHEWAGSASSFSLQ